MTGSQAVTPALYDQMELRNPMYACAQHTSQPSASEIVPDESNSTIRIMYADNVQSFLSQDVVDVTDI